MKVLVTGGAGYIGSHTAKALAEAGHSPIVLDDLSTGHRSAVKWGPLIEGDLGDRELVNSILRDYQIEGVLHFAACLLVGESMTNPQKYFWNNDVSTLGLLDAMKANGVKNIVFSSSAATYGNPEKVPIPEDHPQKPVNPYGESKLFVERMLKWYGSAYGLRWMALRYFNAAGADLAGEIGEAHDPESHLLPLVIQAALGQRAAVEIYGSDYPTPDGTAIRDFIHVNDLAEAHVQALEHLAKDGESTALNLGTGQGHSVLEVIDAVGKFAKQEVPAKKGPRRAGDPAVLVADPGKAERVLGWRPRHSDLETVVRSAWQWHSSQGQKKP